jgi:porin
MYKACGLFNGKVIQVVSIAFVSALTSRVLAAQEFQTNYAPSNPPPYKDQFLFGDWGGVRTDLHEHGVDLNFEGVDDTFGILHGGKSDQIASWPRIRGTLDIDFAKLTHTKGLSLHATGLWQTGVDPGAKLGSLNDPTSLPSAHVFRMDSFYLQWENDKTGLRLRAGQMAGYDYYGNSEEGADYLNLAQGYAFSNLNQNTYLSYNPAGTPAAEIRWVPFAWNKSWLRNAYLKTAVFAGNRNEYLEDPTGLHFQLQNSGVSASEVGYRVDDPDSASETLPTDRKVYPGLYKFGAIINNGTFSDPVTGLPVIGNHLLYLQASQAVYRVSPGSTQGVDVSFGWDHSAADVAEQNSQYMAGVKYNAPFFHRQGDSVAFGFVSTRIDPRYILSQDLLGNPLLDHENMYEINYRAVVKPYLVVQPVFDYYDDVGGNPAQHSATMFGFRIYVRM